MKKTVYPMISLTHIKDEETRNKIRGLIRFLESMPDIELLRWAFDLDTWMPKPVENVFRYDNAFTVGGGTRGYAPDVSAEARGYTVTAFVTARRKSSWVPPKDRSQSLLPCESSRTTQ